MKTVHLVIKGKVQGVFYRASAREKANKLGITGWVKNLPDESVEIMASGLEQRVNDFIDWCHVGPQRAKVTHVLIEERTAESFTGFIIVK